MRTDGALMPLSHYRTPHAICRQGSDPWTPLVFDVYHYLEQNGSFDHTRTRPGS